MWSTSSSSGCPVLRWPSPAWPSGCDWADTTSIRTWSDGDSREACRTSLDGTAPWRTAGGSSTMLGWRAPGFSPVAAARRRRRSSIRRHGSRWWSVTGERPAGSRRYRPHTGGLAADRGGPPAGRPSGAGAPQAGRQPRSGVEGWARRVDYARGSRSPRAGGLRIADGQSVVLPGPGGGDRVLAGEVSTFPRTRRAGALHPAGARAPARHTLPPVMKLVPPSPDEEPLTSGSAPCSKHPRARDDPEPRSHPARRAPGLRGSAGGGDDTGGDRAPSHRRGARRGPLAYPG